MDKSQLISRMLEALGERANGIDFNACELALCDWELVDINNAVVMIKDAEMHVAALPKNRCRWFNRKAVRIMQKQLDKHGFLETSVMIDHQAGHEFARRLGFEQVGNDGSAIRYELRKLRHA